MRRPLRIILLTALLGVVTMYATAWALAAFAQPNPEFTRAIMLTLADPKTTLQRGSLGMRRVKGPGFQTLVVDGTFRPDESDLPLFESLLDEDVAADAQRMLDALRAAGDGPRMSAWFAAGWPLPAVSCEHHRGRGTAGGLVVNRGVTANLGGAAGTIPRALSWRPLWPGAAVNALLFAFGWWVVLFLPGTIRRAHRRRRGRCANCGYDLRAIVDGRCPECGFQKS